MTTLGEAYVPIRATLDKLDKDLAGVRGKVQGALSGPLKSLSNIGTTALKGIAIGTLAIGTAAALVGPKLLDLGGDANETASLLETSLGDAADDLNNRLRTFASDANRSFYELQAGTSTFVAMTRAMGATEIQSANLSAGFTEMATDLGSFFNVDTENALLDIQGALAGSSETMQKYGIDVTETRLKQMALDQGLITTASETLPRLARAQLIQQAIMEQGADAMGDAIRTSDSFSNQLRGVQGVVRDTATEIGQKLIPQAGRIVAVFRAILPGLAQIGAGVAATFSAIVDVGIEFVKSLAQGLGMNFDSLSGDSVTWGQNIVVSFAGGMAGAVSAVIQVLDYIGQIITYWLQPGSPPRLLPQLDKWGSGAMSAYMSGWSSGDFSVFDDIAGIIESHVRSFGDQIPENGIITRIMGGREAVTEAIDQLRQVGSVSEDALSRIWQATGITDSGVKTYIGTLLKLQKANDDVANAQNEVNRVTQEYDAILSPLNDELDAVRQQQQDLRDEQELAEIQSKLAEGSGISDFDREQLMLRAKEIELQKQIRTREDERDIALEAANDKLIAAETERDAIAEQVSAQQSLVDVQNENNKLITDQMSLLERLSDVAGGVGEAIKGKLGGALSALPQMAMDAVGGITGAGDMFAGAFDEVFARVQEKFEPLKAEAQGLGETWAGAFEAIQGALDPITGENGLLATLGIDAETATKFLLGLFAIFLLFKGVLFVVGIFTAVSGAVTFLTGLIGAAGGAAGLMGSLGSLVAFLSGPVGWALIAAGLAIKALIDEYGSWQGAIDAIKENFTGDGTFGPDGIISTAIRMVVDKSLEKIEEWKSKFFTHLENMSETITETLNDWAKSFSDKFSEMRNTVDEKVAAVKGFIEGLRKAAEGFLDFLKNNVFKFNIELPSIPEWAIPGSPLPIHTAWKNFERDMSSMRISPEMDFGGMALAGAGASADHEPAWVINIDARGATDPQEVKRQAKLAVDEALAASGRSADGRIRTRN